MAKEDTGIGPYAIFAGLGLAGGAYLWYRSKKIAPKPPLASKTSTITKTSTASKSSNSSGSKETSSIQVIQTNLGPVVAKPILIPKVSASIMNMLTDQEKLRTGTKAASAKLPNSDMTYEQLLKNLSLQSKTLRISQKIKFDNMRSKGLLGKLVAAHYVFAHGRSTYAKRIGLLSFDDDTPAWRTRENQVTSNKWLEKHLKDSTGPLIGFRNQHWLDRWRGYSTSHADEKQVVLYNSKDNGPLMRRGWSLETTFSNWSGPPFILKNPAAYGWSAFYDGKSKFHEVATALTGRDIVCANYHNPNNQSWADFQERGIYTNIECKTKYKYYNIPWRKFNGAGYSDRCQATYKYSNVLKNDDKTIKAIQRYYEFGHTLVNTVLDIMCSRGECAEDYPAFAEHCTWWFIPQPTREFLTKHPDLTCIGSGVQGLADVSTSELIRYVMAITPKPGTIPPWEDKGPLWLWPTDTGSMQPLLLPTYASWESRASDSTWGTITQYILGFETSICANVASGIVSTAMNQAISWATAVTEEWLVNGIETALSAVESSIGSAAIDMAKEIITDVSSFTANIKTFLSMDAMLETLAKSGNIVASLGEYLEALTDGVTDISFLQDRVQTQLDLIRRNWDWADDLLGETASMPSKVNKTFDKMKLKM